ncbi:hypothetical protein P43SY_004246 [Pythium insidiosum]|uniref:Transmembrane protein n=1 Tax=Pythium insidiosum TaxID=114742 RepID=A0AAD5LAW9_PYTIN|nr:hypothetical protein P43SY_004246 [Pythium insidiosum]
MLLEVNQERFDFWVHNLCTPVSLLINFSLFQYLSGVYLHRRREPLPIALILVAFLGFAVLVPSQYPDDRVVNDLDDVSELCCTLTFLIQIVIIGRDVTKKIKIRSLRVVTHFAELLVVLLITFAIVALISIAHPEVEGSWFQSWNHVVESVALWFIFAFRFGYVGATKGWRHTLHSRRLEIILYVLYATHEYPFIALESITTVRWEPVQGLWNRLTVLFCILYTIRSKILSSRQSKKSLFKSAGPDVDGKSVNVTFEMLPLSERMAFWSHVLCTPLSLLINFSLFQYLVGMYFGRRRELRSALLMTTAFIGFAVLIPAEYPDDEVVANLDDISETASTLTFLIQIVIIGRDVIKKVKIRSLRVMTLCAELLILIEFACIVLALLSIIHPRIGMSWYHDVNHIIEDVSLCTGHIGQAITLPNFLLRALSEDDHACRLQSQLVSL